eukprot:jgi/Botrbrau1/6670/Bobra.0202s0018.1
MNDPRTPTLPGVGDRTLDQVLALSAQVLDEATKDFLSCMGPFIAVPATFTSEAATRLLKPAVNKFRVLEMSTIRNYSVDFRWFKVLAFTNFGHYCPGVSGFEASFFKVLIILKDSRWVGCNVH